MTGYTPKGLPFPSPEDAANTVADQVRALAEAVDTMHLATAAGTVFVPGPVAFVDIAFPAGRFPSAPIVTANAVAGANNVAIAINTGSATTTGVRLWLYGIGGNWTSGAISVYWHAMAQG